MSRIAYGWLIGCVFAHVGDYLCILRIESFNMVSCVSLYRMS